MVFWACSAVTLGSALLAVFVGDIRRAVFALWGAGMGAGGIYLSLGFELLAVVQWIVSTLVAISFVFYSVMFGEYGVADPRPLGRRAVSAILPLIIGLAVTGVIWLGLRGLSDLPGAVAPAQGQNLGGLGSTLIEENFLSLDILALTLFLVIVGAGVIARPEVMDE